MRPLRKPTAVRRTKTTTNTGSNRNDTTNSHDTTTTTTNITNSNNNDTTTTTTMNDNNSNSNNKNETTSTTCSSNNVHSTRSVSFAPDPPPFVEDDDDDDLAVPTTEEEQDSTVTTTTTNLAPPPLLPHQTKRRTTTTTTSRPTLLRPRQRNPLPNRTLNNNRSEALSSSSSRSANMMITEKPHAHDNDDDNDDDTHPISRDTQTTTTAPPHPPNDDEAPEVVVVTADIPKLALPAAATTSHTTSTTNNNNNHHNASSSSAAAAASCCPNCGSNQLEPHEASGATICTECGVVTEENAIVAAIEFVEGAGGSSNMVGQYVSATSSKAYTNSGSGGGAMRGGGRYGFSRDSRETTLANGRRRIQELAARLRLSSHYVDGAHRLFTVAVERNFVQGRRTAHVVAACLYMACRQEKSQHMLIDFSDALQVNVYTLGTCFLKFRRLLGLKLEIIDPALYVYRFAAHLDLDDRANAVSLTALRLVARMKRDWIVAGRRPAGICAAALLIAARAHGFDQQCADVTRILRVCGMTVTNRMREFERTPSAHLSLDQIQTIDFEAEADPPIYTKNKMREARAKAIQEGNVQLLTSGVLDDDGKRGSQWRNQATTTTTKKAKPASERSIKFQELYQNLDKSLNDDMIGGDNTEDPVPDPGLEMANDDPQDLQNQQLVVPGDETTTTTLVQWKDAYPKNRGRDMVMPHEATVEEQLPATVPTEAKLSLSDWKHSLPNEIDLEIEDFFRSSKEEKEKEAIFNKINKDYIAQQERKENERLDLEAATKDQDVDDLAQAAGQARYKDVVGRNHHHTKSNKRQRESSSGGGGDATNPGSSSSSVPATTEEQLRAAVASRKVSRKINYDALSSIFDDDGSFAIAGGPDEYGNIEDDDDDDDNQQ